MNIFTILTGGTIGSRINNNGFIASGSESSYRIIEMYNKKYGIGCNFTTCEPYNILSENITANHILLLVKTVKNAVNAKKYDGIIITHGTDTLQYSAALLGYMLGDAGIPIVLVSSAYILDDDRANGLVNFNAAVNFIKRGVRAGVYVSYRNDTVTDIVTDTDAVADRESALIHTGTRLQPPIPYSADIYSVNDGWFAKYYNGEIILNPDYTNVPGAKQSMLGYNYDYSLSAESSQILYINPNVGMSYPKLSDEIKAILFGSYHSGTICTDERLKNFTQEASERNIPMFLTGLPDSGSEYETVGEYRKLGIIPLRESSAISQYCKLWLAVSNNENIKTVMSESVADDHIH